jgi:hypothetical protein
MRQSIQKSDGDNQDGRGDLEIGSAVALSDQAKRQRTLILGSSPPLDMNPLAVHIPAQPLTAA